MSIAICLIVAVSENGIIGHGGGLPWRLSSDLKTFRKLTMGKPIVMGRKTFDSIGKPLDGRDNIVVTRQPDWTVPGVRVVTDVAAAVALAQELAKARGVDEVMVIGGAEIYDQTFAMADRLYLTLVHATIEGDATFPKVDPDEWREVRREAGAQGPKDDHPWTLVVLDRA